MKAPYVNGYSVERFKKDRVVMLDLETSYDTIEWNATWQMLRLYMEYKGNCWKLCRTFLSIVKACVRVGASVTDLFLVCVWFWQCLCFHHDSLREGGSGSSSTASGSSLPDESRRAIARPLVLLSFMPTLLLSIFTLVCLPSSSLFLSYFIIVVSMHKCWGQHSCMSSSFSILIPNGHALFSLR